MYPHTLSMTQRMFQRITHWKTTGLMETAEFPWLLFCLSLFLIYYSPYILVLLTPVDEVLLSCSMVGSAVSLGMSPQPLPLRCH